ncbi:MAG: LCP family protein, partial [Actinomycetales bacterium]
GDGSDTSRIRRQQAFISSMARQVLSAGTLLNPAALISILTAASESLSADPALADVNNLKDLALSMKDLRPSDITFVTMPWKPAGDRVNVLVNDKKAKVLWDAIANDTQYPPKRDEGAPVLKTEPSGVYVNVLNGTGVKGAAKKAAKKLRKAGFRVMEVGNVEDGQVYEKTTVIFDPKWDVSSRTLVYAANAMGQPEKKHGQRMDLIIGKDFTDLREVEIDEISSDVYTNLNTADENFCAS